MGNIIIFTMDAEKARAVATFFKWLYAQQWSDALARIMDRINARKLKTQS